MRSDARGVTRREALGLLGLGGAVAVAPWGLAWGAAPLRLGVRPRSYSGWAVAHARDGGLWAASGVEVRQGGDGAEALARGELDLAVLPTPLALALHLGTGPFAGRPTPLVVGQVALTGGSTLVVRAASGIEFSRQFEGKTVGVTDELGMPRLLTDVYLLQSGLQPGQDTRWAAVAPEAVGEELRAGRVDAVAAEEWGPAEAVGAGDARLMLSLSRLWEEHPADVLVATRDAWRTRGPEVEACFRATVGAARALAEGAWAARAEAAGGAAPRAFGESRAGFAPFPYLSAFRVILEEMKKRGWTPLNADLKAEAEALCLTGPCREWMAVAGFGEVPGEDSREERMIGCCYTF